MIRDRYAEAHRLTGEDRLCTGETQLEAHQVALALVHRYEADADQQERQYEGQVVVVIHRSEQHRKRHDAENDADAGRQDIDTAGTESGRGGVLALPLAGPAPNPVNGTRSQRTNVTAGTTVWPRYRGHVGRVRPGCGIEYRRQA